MSYVLDSLQPREVFRYFEEISKIPRESGNEKQISDYMMDFAKGLGLEAKQDEAYNVYIRKPATPGYENVPGVIMQGHLDMVCEKNNDVNHDFSKEGLDLFINEDWIGAKGTTLGADNGVAIAYQMAVLADKSLKHPQIECLMTTDEERGMTGVKNLHPEYLTGKILLNLDSDAEGEFFLSCAGGAKTTFIVPTIKSSSDNNDASIYKIVVNGLKGGHSGAEIHLERANAHILVGRILASLRDQIDFNLVDIQGGSKDNVITRECEVLIQVSDKDKSKFENIISEIGELLKSEYETQDPEMYIGAELLENNLNVKVIDKQALNKFIDFMTVVPNGVMGYDVNMKGLVQTSLNLGVIKFNESNIEFGISVRSSVGSKKQELLDKLKTLSDVLGLQFTVQGNYPAWQYNPNSKIRDFASELYKEMYSKEPVMTAIHAGLECGFIAEKISGLDMISFGPNVRYIHSPKEVVSISSMARVYEYIVKLLEKLVAY